MPDANQRVRVLERQRTQQDAVDHAENGRVGADAECQRDHGNCSEAGAFVELSQRVAKVLG